MVKYFNILLHCSELALHSSIIVSNLELCSGVRSTYVSYENSRKSLINKILVFAENVHCAGACEICNDNTLNGSKHSPVICIVTVPLSQLNSINTPDEISCVNKGG